MAPALETTARDGLMKSLVDAMGQYGPIAIAFALIVVVVLAPLMTIMVLQTRTALRERNAKDKEASSERKEVETARAKAEERYISFLENQAKFHEAQAEVNRTLHEGYQRQLSDQRVAIVRGNEVLANIAQELRTNTELQKEIAKFQRLNMQEFRESSAEICRARAGEAAI